MSTKSSNIDTEKNKGISNYLKNARKKVLAILAIMMLLMQYMVVPIYAAAKGDLSPGDCPYDIEIINATLHRAPNSSRCKALDSDGNLWYWGPISYSEGSSTSYTTYSTPKKNEDSRKYIDISGILLLDSEGKLYKSETDRHLDFTSTEIGDGRTFNKIDYSFAIDKTGKLWAYGYNRGNLGTGKTEENLTTLTAIKREKYFKEVACGYNSSLAIDKDGNLYSCGNNKYGELGNGNNDASYEFNQILNGVKFDQISISKGYYNTSSMAIDTDGNLWTWGNNEYGQLGNGTRDSSNVPSKIMEGTKFKKISAGNKYSMAIDYEGNLWTWGNNEYGQLGNETRDSSNVPSKIMEGTTFEKIITDFDGSQSMAIDTNGSLWTWGSNEYTYGDGTNQDSTAPIQITKSSRTYTVNFYDEDGTTLLDTKKVSSGNEATTNVTPTKDSTVEHSYTFEKWVAMDGSDIDLSNITQDTNVKAKYREDARGYNVKFVNDNGSTLEEKTVSYGNKATYTGVTPSKSKYGYICTFKGWDKDPNTTTITEDTVFTAQFDIEVIPYTIMYENIDKATFTNENRTEYTVETEDFTLNNPSSAGYTFLGWEGTELEGRQMNVTVHRGSTGNRTYRAVWAARNDTKYKVEHYKQKVDGTYGTEPDEIENKTGVTQSTATAKIKTYTGYTEDTENPNRLVSGTIAGDGSLVLKVYYKANTNTSYRVEHYLQNLDNTNYTIDNEATEHKLGTTGRQTTAEAKTYEGFTALNFSQETIAGDGSTVVKIYYNRNRNTSYKIEHYKQKADGTYPEKANDTENKEGTTGEIVTATAKQYIGYTEDTTNSDRIATGVINGDGSLTLKLYYKANTDTAYKVEHYKQRPNGSYPNIADETEEKSGTTGTIATAEAKQYEGYTEDTTNGNRIVSGTIYGDGSLVLRLYYKANTNTTYKVEHYKQNLDGTYPDTPSETEEKSGKTGANVVAQAKVYEGYVEDTANTNRVPSGTIVGDGSLNLKLYYKVSENTLYKVEHYKQKPDGTYPEKASETEQKTGKTGANVTAEAKAYAGYTEDETNKDRVVSGKITGNGKLVLKLYYKANTDTAYKIEHYKQKPDGTYGNVADEIEERTGITGENVTAEAKTYEGYTEDTTNKNRIISGTIAGDGSLILKIYYKMNEDDTKHIVVTPGEDEDGKKNIEISSTSPKEIEKVTVNGEEVEKDENGKYIYYPNENGTYEIEVTYKDGTTEKVIYEETRLNNNSNNNNDNNNNDNKNTINKNTHSNSNKNAITSGTNKDDTLATKILSKTGRTYMGVVVLLIVIVMSIIVLIKKYRDNKNN